MCVCHVLSTQNSKHPGTQKIRLNSLNMFYIHFVVSRKTFCDRNNRCKLQGKKEAEMNKDGKPHSPTIRTTLLASGLSFQARSEDWDKFVWASFLFQVHVNVWTEFFRGLGVGSIV